MTRPDENAAKPGVSHGFANPAKWVPVIIVTLGSVWAVHYVWHTNQNSYGDQDTVLFINFLIWPLVASAILVAFTTLKSKAQEPDVDLSDPRRLILLIAMPLYGVAIVYAGFVIASALFVLILLPVLGIRNPIFLAGISAFVIAVIWFGFSYLMSVPLPLWPRGVGL